MNKWNKCQFSDIADLRREGFTPNYSEVLPYIGLEHIEQGTLRLNGIGSSNDVTSQKLKFYPDDILYGKLRPYFQKVYPPKFKGICSTDIFVFRAKEGIHPKFLFYIIASDLFTSYANQSSTGTRMPRADWKHLSDTIWKIPDLPTQTAIAEILSSLDDKIELNNKINTELEALAQTLFKQWFIDFEFPDENGLPYKSSGGKMVESELGMIPEGWQVDKFINQIKVSRGISYKGDGLTDIENGIPMINLNSVNESGGYKYQGLKFYSGEYKERHIIKPGEIAITNTEQGHKYHLIGYPAVVPKSIGPVAIFTQHIYRATAKNESVLSNAFLYYLILQKPIREQIIGACNGTTVNMLKIDGLQSPIYTLPNIEIVNLFTETIHAIWDKKETIQVENNELKTLRDLLIPKLISGEIMINE